MGDGLKALEYIQKGEYIVPYEGTISFQKPKGNSEYVVEIKFESDTRKGKRVCYVDAKTRHRKVDIVIIHVIIMQSYTK